MNSACKKLILVGEPHQRRHPLQDGGVKITTFVPLRFKKRGIKKVVIAPAGVSEPVIFTVSAPAISPTNDTVLLRALGRGFYWQQLLDSGAVKDAAEIARREGLHRVTVNDGLRFALLAPDIVQAAMDGSLIRTLSLEYLQRNTIPIDWEGQRTLMAELG